MKINPYITPSVAKSLLFLLCMQLVLTGQSLWDTGDNLTPESGGSEWPWNHWSTEQFNDWKYFDGLGPIWQWKDSEGNLKSKWVYSYFHGWLYPVGEDLNSIWLFSIKYNKSWVWTGINHFNLFYFHNAESFFKYDTESFGRLFLDLSSGEWIEFEQITNLFSVDYTVLSQLPPNDMVKISQGRFKVGGNYPSEPYSDNNDNNTYDTGEPYDDINGNGKYDDQQFGYDDESPQHYVDLSSFFVSKYEVTNQLWQTVVDWALARDDKAGDPYQDFFKYEFDSLIYVNFEQVLTYFQRMKRAEEIYHSDPTHNNKDDWDLAIARYEQQLLNRDLKIEEILEYRDNNPLHAVNYISWFDALKWCNAYSEMTGRMPVYYVDPGLGGVLRSSRQARTSQNVFFEFKNGFVKWNADGYRLPTESEWETACRGGLIDKEFSTGDTIDDTLANIDIDPNALPKPSPKPVGSFPPNNYGLYDISGNLREWCWDWKANYDELSAEFTLNIEPSIHSFKITIPDVTIAGSSTELVDLVRYYLELFNPATDVQVGESDNKLFFTITSTGGPSYFVVDSPDRNAQNVLGLRDLDSSLNLVIPAAQPPISGWATDAQFVIDYVVLSNGSTGSYAVNVTRPASGALNSSPHFAYAEAINLAFGEMNIGHLYAASVEGDKLAIVYQRGNTPVTFSIRASGDDPFVNYLGFASFSEVLVDQDTLRFEAFNHLKPLGISKNPQGPDFGEVRSFRGGYYEYGSFHARATLRNGGSPYTPSKKVGFRPVIGLPWDDR